MKWFETYFQKKEGLKIARRLYLTGNDAREFQSLNPETQYLIRILAGEEYIFEADEHIHFLGLNLRRSKVLVEIAHSLKSEEPLLITWQEGLDCALKCLDGYHAESYRHSLRVKELVLQTKRLWEKYCYGDLPQSPVIRQYFDQLRIAYPDCPSQYLDSATGFSESDWADVLYSALFHDLGKMGFPDWFWTKPGKFTEEQKGYRKNHPWLFFPLGEMFAVPLKVTALALYHHFLNLGYPQNDLTSLFGDYLQDYKFKCILCLLTTMDIYDGMRGERSYRREVFSHEQVIAKMPNELGDIDLRFVPFLEAAFELGELKPLYVH